MTDLKQFATPQQLRYLEAIEKYGSQRAACKALGLTRSSLQEAVNRVKRKAARQGYSPEHDMTKTVPDGYMVKGVSSLYDKDGKLTAQWLKSSVDEDRREELIRAWIAAAVEEVKGLAPATPKPKHACEDLLAVYPAGDPHFGLYCWWQDAGSDFDLSTAERLMTSAVDRLVASAPAAKTALFLNLGDMYHADNQKNQSQSGHQLDVDGRFNRGNHDGHSSYALALMLSCYFHDEPRVEVDLSPSVLWYYRFGRVLLGSTHGDTIKGKDMISVMAADRPEDWGMTKHRHMMVGHVHHHDSKEYPGGIVEYFRTLAARDAWHTAQGYRAGRDMLVIVFHKTHGEIERHRVDVAMLDASTVELGGPKARANVP